MYLATVRRVHLVVNKNVESIFVRKLFSTFFFCRQKQCKTRCKKKVIAIAMLSRYPFQYLISIAILHEVKRRAKKTKIQTSIQTIRMRKKAKLEYMQKCIRAKTISRRKEETEKKSKQRWISRRRDG